MKKLQGDLSNIKEDVLKNTGVYRTPVPDLKIEAGKSVFQKIGGFFLENEKQTYEFRMLEPVIEKMIKWVYLQECGLDFRKGILLKGKTGRGKTMLFKIFTKFVKIDDLRFKENGKSKPFNLQIVNVKQISGEYQDPENGGYAVIEKYAKVNCLVLDDIGKEDTRSNNYGNKTNVVEAIIDLREERGMLTFGTTNLDRFSEMYDDRTISRMNKLFNVIPINHNKDYRR